MKTWKVKIEFVGLTGIYYSEFEVKARTESSAKKRAYEHVGDRSYNSITVTKVGL